MKNVLERKPVPDWPYEVDEEGWIYRTGKSNSTTVGYKISRRLSPDKYWKCSLSKPGARCTQFSVHTVVCMAWHGPRPAGMQTRHLDGDKNNNRPDNLCWGTPEENQEDARRHGSHLSGEDNPMNVYPDSVVKALRKRHQAHLKARNKAGHKWARRGFIYALAEEFDVPYGYINQLLHRKGLRK